MKILTVRGTGEPMGAASMIGTALAGIANVVELPYAAQIRPVGWQTLGQSVAQARQLIGQQDQVGEPWFGVAYSLGALTLGDAVAQDDLQHCVGVALIADPMRAASQCSNGGVDPSVYGCAGSRPISGVNWHQFAIPDDPITSCPPGSGFRNVADMVTGSNQQVAPSFAGFADTMTEIERYLIGTPNLNPADDFHLSRHCAYPFENMPGTTQTYMQAVRALVEAL